MRTCALGLCALAFLSSTALADASKLNPASSKGVPDRWMVRFTDRVSADDVERVAQSLVGPSRVVTIWKSGLRGFVGIIPAQELERVSADPRVRSLHQDLELPNAFSTPLPDCSMGSDVATAAPSGALPQTIRCDDPDPQNPSGVCPDNWGLDRLDGASTTRDGRYAPTRTGAGVHLFVIDTGLFAGHQDFAGRVGTSFDATGAGRPVDDCDAWSHGTHVAAIAAGLQFGVAKGVTVHSVRVAGCPISLTISSVVSAYDWITQVHTSTIPGPAVATMSINANAPELADLSNPLNVAIIATIQAGVTVVESAGNGSGDACGSIVHAPGVLIVGGSDEFDTPWERSPGDPNYAGWCSGGGDCGSNGGFCVHLYAPAAHIVSAWRGVNASPGATCRLSGTSMAAPHAAGAAALFLESNPTASPALVVQELEQRSKPVLTQLPTGSPNRLLSVNTPIPSVTVGPPGLTGFPATEVQGLPSLTTLTVTSDGTGDLQVGSLSITGAQAVDFGLASDHCSGVRLSPGQSCSVDVRFTPSAPGSRVAVLQIPSNAMSTPLVQRTMIGTGMAPMAMDAGQGGVDAGVPPADAGVPPRDAGIPAADAGPTVDPVREEEMPKMIRGTPACGCGSAPALIGVLSLLLLRRRFSLRW